MKCLILYSAEKKTRSKAGNKISQLIKFLEIKSHSLRETKIYLYTSIKIVILKI